jgi:hypothetical protein
MTEDASEIAAIKQTMAAYNIAGDRMKLEALAAAFTPDGVLETTTGRFDGRAAIAGGLGRGDPDAALVAGRRPTVVRHNLTTSLIELTAADEARGRTYFMVYTDIGADHIGVYVDRFRKTDGVWLIAHRRVLIDWVSEDSLFPTVLAAHRARLAQRATTVA